MDNAADTPEFKVPEGLEIVAAAGSGRRSNWFQAKQIRLNRTVALKFLRPMLAEKEAMLESFLEAGRQAAAVVHPSALPIINVHPRHHCLVVQWCEGKALDARGTLNALRAALVGEMTMDCLSALHATGRSHGNLSPGNIFLGDNGRVWLEDFFQPARVRAGALLFSANPKYVAPEIAKEEPGDWRSDVFALGRVLNEAATADRPDRLAGLLAAICAADPAARGESPQAVQAAFRKVRLAEEGRLGINRGSLRRRRMYRRVPAEFEVSLRRRSATPGETASILMKIRDIGESGVFVETEDDLIGIGSILELEFTLKGMNVHAFGVVRWRSGPPMPKGVGVQFVEVDQDGLRNLRKYLEGK